MIDRGLGMPPTPDEEQRQIDAELALSREKLGIDRASSGPNLTADEYGAVEDRQIQDAARDHAEMRHREAMTLRLAAEAERHTAAEARRVAEEARRAAGEARKLGLLANAEVTRMLQAMDLIAARMKGLNKHPMR